jgi:hypothetical protein
VALEIGLPLDVGDLVGVAGGRLLASGRLGRPLATRQPLVERGVAGLRPLALRDRGRLAAVGEPGVIGGDLGVCGRHLLAIAGVDVVFTLGLLEDGILLKLLLDEVHQLQLVQLQQLDRLLQLGRHDQLLRHPELLFQFDGHASPAYPVRRISARRH